MVDKIYELKNEFIKRIEHDLSERGVDRIDVKEMGELVDMVKDLAEAEDYCWQAEYYKSITKAMDSRSSEHEVRSGYKTEIRPSHIDHSANHDVITPVRDAIQAAAPEERERLKSEIKAIIMGR